MTNNFSRSAFTFLFFFCYLLSPIVAVGDSRISFGELSIFALFALFVMRVLLIGGVYLFKPLVPVLALALFLVLYTFLLSVTLDSEGEPSYVGYVIKVTCYILAGYCFGCFFYKNLSISVGDLDRDIGVFLKIFVVVALVNSLLIYAQVFSPDFRVLSNSIFISPNSNIDFVSRSDRFKGVANGGGANLSILNGFALLSLVYLFINERVKAIYFAISFVFLAPVNLWVGRTGFFLALSGLLFVIPLILKRPKIFILLLLVILGSVVFFVFYFDISERVVSRYFFFVQGVSGVKSEGTIGTLFSWLSFPDNFSSFLFGIGNASGSFLHNSAADMGYFKTFTMYGVPLALFFYGLIAFSFYIFLIKLNLFRLLFSIFFFLVFFVEFKEPFLFKGGTARFLYFCVGFGVAYTFILKRKFLIESVTYHNRAK